MKIQATTRTSLPWENNKDSSSPKKEQSKQQKKTTEERKSKTVGVKLDVWA